MTPNVVTVEGFPHGLRCMDCGSVLEPGMAYSERLTGFTQDVVCVELTCVPCGLRWAT